MLTTDLPKDESSLDAEGVTQIEFKDLGRSKWLDDLDEEDNKRTESLKGKSNVLSGLLRTYGKEGKSVRWGDQVCYICWHPLYYALQRRVLFD